MSEHRWSGWPGAWCLDCGAEDKRELCCVIHSENDPEKGTVCERPECQNDPCPEPGSHRNDPYWRPEDAADVQVGGHQEPLVLPVALATDADEGEADPV